jgi:hypothetical protein
MKLSSSAHDELLVSLNGKDFGGLITETVADAS